MNKGFIILLIGCAGLSAVVTMADTNVVANVDEYQSMSTNVLYIEKLLTERMLATGRSVWSNMFRGTQQTVLSSVKNDIHAILTSYVDHGQFTNSSEGWFETPLGIDTNGNLLYPDNFPMYDQQELMASVGAPTNYLEYTPWRPLTANAPGYTNAEMQAGTDSTDYGWKYVVPILKKFRLTAKEPVSISVDSVRIRSYGIDTNGYNVYYFGSRSCTISPPDWPWPCFPYSYPKQGEEADDVGNMLMLEDNYLYRNRIAYSEYHNPTSVYSGHAVSHFTDEYRIIMSNLCVEITKTPGLAAIASVHLVGSGDYENFYSATVAYAEVADEECSDRTEDEEWYYDYATIGNDRCFVYPVNMAAGVITNILTIDRIDPPAAGDVPQIELHTEAEAYVACEIGNITYTQLEERETTLRRRVFRAYYTPRILLDWQFNYE